MGLSTKINANIGTSTSHALLPEELDKLQVAIDAGAHAVMDLSTGGDIDAILAGMIEHSTVMIGTVPIYRSISRLFAGSPDLQGSHRGFPLSKTSNTRPVWASIS